MKKWKKLLVSVLAVAMLLGTTAFAEEVDSNTALVLATRSQVQTGGTYTYTDASELSRFVQLGYATNQVVYQGPITVTKGTLNTTSSSWFSSSTSSKDVYLIALSGTDTEISGQTTGYWTDLLSGFEFDNQYNRNVKNVILSNIPTGSNIVLAGHSLGGMIAQQIASDSTIKANYNVLNTVTFGSPLINGFKREGTVKRLGDTSDVVPYMSLTTFTNIIWQSAGLNKESGGYSYASVAAHCESYNRSDVWGAYDVTGTKGGNASLTLDFSTTTFYYSPTTVTE